MLDLLVCEVRFNYYGQVQTPGGTYFYYFRLLISRLHIVGLNFYISRQARLILLTPFPLTKTKVSKKRKVSQAGFLLSLCTTTYLSVQLQFHLQFQTLKGLLNYYHRKGIGYGLTYWKRQKTSENQIFRHFIQKNINGHKSEYTSRPQPSIHPSELTQSPSNSL